MKATKLFWARYVVMGVVGASLLLAACSSGGGGTGQPQGEATPTPTSAPTTVARTPTATPTARPSPSPAGTAREIRVTLKDNAFPKEIRVKAGETVVFVVTNEGTVMHSLETPDFDFYREIKEKQTERFEWVVPNKKARWDMGCYLTGEGFHEGMEGTLIIE